MGKLRSKFFVSNKDLLAEIEDYRKTGNISETLHMMFYKMCNNIINRPRFFRYTKEWKDDMIQSSYVKAVSVLMRGTFTEGRTNPFSYFTTVITRSMLDMAGGEKRQKDIIESLKNIITSIQ